MQSRVGCGVVALLDKDWSTIATTVEPDDGLSSTEETALDDALTRLQMSRRHCRAVYRTLADLEALDTSDVSDANAWQAQLDLAADRVQAFERRAVALASGDEDELAAVFAPTAVFQIHAGIDWGPLRLANRDCAAMAV